MAAEGECDLERFGTRPKPPEQHGCKTGIIEVGLVAPKDVIDLAQDGGGATGLDGGGAGA